VRATLDRLGPSSEVVVAELVPAVVTWNQGVLAPLAGRPLEDTRVRVAARDVGDILRTAEGHYDAILLDVDNGPEAITQEGNRWLYGERGLATVRRALKPRGVVVVWSAAPDAAFVSRLKRAGYDTQVIETPARGKGGGPLHTLFIGRVRPSGA
jgi:spermidine synthase